MTASERFLGMSARDLRMELEELFADYVACLDEERFEEWPEFFTENCIYRVTPRENFERNLPVSTVHCESKRYLVDRVVQIRKTAVYGPRYYRRLISNVRIRGWHEGVLKTQANYAAFETLYDEGTRILSVGRTHDEWVVVEGKLKFASRIVVFDTELVPNSLIYPL